MKAIMYHYVRPDDPNFPFFRHLNIDHFKKQLDYFDNEFGFVSQKQFEECLISGEPTEGVILTFDDGFQDHFSYVLPELLKRDLWGIFYVPTFPFLTNKLLDVHRIHVLIGKFGGAAIAEALEDRIEDGMISHTHIEEFHLKTYSRQNNDDLTNYVKRLLNYFIDYKFRQNLIDSLMSDFFPLENELVNEFYMSEEELVKMKTSGMVIGSHTVNHLVMSKLSADEQRLEIERSFNFLGKIAFASSKKTFCYPYGGFHSFTDETIKILEDNKCIYSFNVEPRDITSDDLLNHRQALPRYDCNQFPWGSSV